MGPASGAARVPTSAPRSNRRGPQGDPAVRREDDSGSPEDDDGAPPPGYRGRMRARTVLDQLRRRGDALLAVALAIALQLQLALADGVDATPVAVVAGLALTLPLAW